MLTPRLTFTSVALSLALVAMPSAFAADKKPAPAATKAASSAKAEAALIKIENAWVRPMVKGQTATGGFMVLTASQDLTLVGFASPAAGSSELHEMVMDGSVMRMGAIDALKLPVGQAVTLRPGAHHLMLMDVKQALKEGDEVSLTLQLKASDGKALTQEIKVPVKAGAMMMGGGQGAGPHHGMHGSGAMHQHMHQGKMPAQPASAAK